ncbi:DUF211 domain-containing protein [Candidatus Micrarchaeota archaeon]|nr:DUF211 domain-containing protein [Candidatus Micrarchaeota archaeon]
MTGIRRLVLDVLKPGDLSLVDMAADLGKLKNVQGVDIVVKDVDRRVEKVRITVEGDDLDYSTIKKRIEDDGASIQSVDRVSSGKEIIDKACL